MENSSILVYAANGYGSFITNIQRHANKYYGAMPSVANGINGNSYAIQTRDTSMRPIDISEIKKNVDKFLQYAFKNPEKIFKVTHFPGFGEDEIAPLFVYASTNVVLPLRYKKYLSWDGMKRKYWNA